MADPLDILTGRVRRSDGGDEWGATLANLASAIASIPERRARAARQRVELEVQQQNADVRAGDLMLRQQQQQQQEAAKAKIAQMDQAVSVIVSGAMVDGPDGVKRFDRKRIMDGFARIGAPLDVQSKTLKSLDDVEESGSKLEEARRDHAARVLNAVLDAPDLHQAALMGIAEGKANGWLKDSDIEPLYAILSSDQDPKPVLRQLRDTLSDKYRAKREVKDIGPGHKLIDEAGQIIAENALQEKPDKAPTLGSFEDFVTRKFGAEATPEQILEARRLYGQADDRPRVNVSVAGSGEGALTPDAVDYTATAYRLLGTRAIPTRISGNERAKILNAAAAQSKALGQSPAAAVTKQLTTRADSNALSTLGKLSSSAEAFENKALGQADIISELSAKVPRTKFPIINDAIQAGRERITGDEDATKLANAITTFASEYAKIMEGSTGSVAGSSDASRKAASRLINTGMSKGTLDGVLDLMKREMRLTIQGYDVAKEHITDRIGGAAPPIAEPANRVKLTRDKDGNIVPVK